MFQARSMEQAPLEPSYFKPFLRSLHNQAVTYAALGSPKNRVLFRFSPSDLFPLRLVRSTTASASKCITNHSKTSMEHVMRVESSLFQDCPFSAPLTSSLPKLCKHTHLPFWSATHETMKRDCQETISGFLCISDSDHRPQERMK